MSKHRLSKTQVLDAFNNGEKILAGRGGRWNAIKKYLGYEIEVNYDQDSSGR